jgi:hypothetical protein
VVGPGLKREANVEADSAKRFELPPSARVLDEGWAHTDSASTEAAKLDITAPWTDATIFAETRCPRNLLDQVVLLLIEFSRDSPLSAMT